MDLTRNELKILYYLFRHPGEIVSRGDLTEYLWDQDVFIDDNALSVHMTRIRNKLSALGVDHMIKTKRGMGYILQGKNKIEMTNFGKFKDKKIKIRMDENDEI